MTITDPTERAIINGLQGGFPLTRRPYRDAGAALGLSEGELLDGIGQLVESGRLSRFGPLWNAEKFRDPKSLPTVGEMLASAKQGFDGKAYDREWPARAAKTMW